MKVSLLKTRRFPIFQRILYFLPQFFSFKNKCLKKFATFLQIILLVCKLPRYYDGIRNWVSTRKKQICMRTNLRYANWNKTTIILGLPSHWWIVEALDSILLYGDPNKFGAVDLKKGSTCWWTVVRVVNPKAHGAQCKETLICRFCKLK